MDSTAAAWAASIIVENLDHNEVVTHHRSKNHALVHYKAKLEMVGLKTLKKSQLLSLWEHLRDMPFVKGGGIPSVSKSAKKGIWVDHITTCLSLDAAGQLKPINTATNGSTSTPSARIPPVASAPAASFQAPPVASVP